MARVLENSGRLLVTLDESLLGVVSEDTNDAIQEIRKLMLNEMEDPPYGLRLRFLELLMGSDEIVFTEGERAKPHPDFLILLEYLHAWAQQWSLPIFRWWCDAVLSVCKETLGGKELEHALRVIAEHPFEPCVVCGKPAALNPRPDIAPISTKTRAPVPIRDSKKNSGKPEDTCLECHIEYIESLRFEHVQIEKLLANHAPEDGFDLYWIRENLTFETTRDQMLKVMRFLEKRGSVEKINDSQWEPEWVWKSVRA